MAYLILARRENERVLLSFDEMSDAQLLALRHQTIDFIVSDIRSHDVKIGFDAPRCVSVLRSELVEGQKART